MVCGDKGAPVRRRARGIKSKVAGGWCEHGPNEEHESCGGKEVTESSVSVYFGVGGAGSGGYLQQSSRLGARRGEARIADYVLRVRVCVRVRFVTRAQRLGQVGHHWHDVSSPLQSHSPGSSSVGRPARESLSLSLSLPMVGYGVWGVGYGYGGVEGEGWQSCVEEGIVSSERCTG